jgi:hypothetical protein
VGRSGLVGTGRPAGSLAAARARRGGRRAGAGGALLPRRSELPRAV